MEGDQKFLIIVVCIALICVTILYSFLFLALWPYRQWVGISLLVLLVVSIGVFLRGKVTEQNLRTIRYRHTEETPLDERGEPMYWQDGYQPNPHRH